MLLHIDGIDLDGLAMAVGCCEGDIIEHALHHGLQPPCADILYRGVHCNRHIGERVDGVVGDIKRDAFGLQQGDQAGRLARGDRRASSAGGRSPPS